MIEESRMKNKAIMAADRQQRQSACSSFFAALALLALLGKTAFGELVTQVRHSSVGMSSKQLCQKCTSAKSILLKWQYQCLIASRTREGAFLLKRRRRSARNVYITFHLDGRPGARVGTGVNHHRPDGKDAVLSIQYIVGAV